MTQCIDDEVCLKLDADIISILQCIEEEVGDFIACIDEHEPICECETNYIDRLAGYDLEFSNYMVEIMRAKELISSARAKLNCQN